MYELSSEQEHAVKVIKKFISCYNSQNGTGLFSGISRYHMLESRVKIAAIQSNSLMDFWSNLRQKLMCPVPNRNMDDDVIALWQYVPQNLVLKCLATQAAECIMLARVSIDEDKEKDSQTKIFGDENEI